jgi:SAM-dependent methyltransferase
MSFAELRGAISEGRWAEALERYEAAVLGVLGTTPDAAPVARWARAYDALSEQLTAERQRALAKQSSAELSGEDALAVAGLVYGARSFYIASRLLRTHGLAPGSIHDLGCGWGAGALAGMAAGASAAVLSDVDARVLERASLLFAALGLSASTVLGSFERARPASNAVLAYSLNELRARGGDGRAVVSELLRSLGPGGRLFVFDPGTQECGAAMSALRDGLADRVRVLGPCTHQAPCPLRDSPLGWCHFTLPIPLGPVASAIAHSAHKQHHVVRFSWLALEVATPSPASSGRRVLSLQREKGKTRLLGCGAGGAEMLTRLDRAAAADEVLESGDVLELGEGVERRGDGLRLGPTAILHRRPL